MARTLRTELELASALLHKVASGDELTEGDRRDAVVATAAVNAVLEPGGWTQIREEEGAFTSNLAITSRASVRDALHKAAESRRKTLTALVTEGYRKVLAGEWTPPRRSRAGRIPAGDSRAMLNVTIEDALRQEIRAALPRLSQELGYSVTEGGIAMSYLMQALEPELAKLLPDSAE